MAGDLHKLAKLAYLDSGPVPGSSTYTTVVMIHGLGWHSESFRHMLPHAAPQDMRLILLNRRDYPGSEPLSQAERAPVEAIAQSSTATEKTVEVLETFMRDRVREVADFLGAFVKRERIPERRGGRGGIVLCAWSLAGTEMLAFLDNASSSSSSSSSFGGDVQLERYMRHVVLYDPPYNVLGYPHPANFYHPLVDEAIPPSEREAVFAKWLSGYYTHGSTEETLETRKWDAEPPPILTVMTPDEISACFIKELAQPNGIDFTLLNQGYSTGLIARLRERAFFPSSKLLASETESEGSWANVPIHYLWCERSEYEMAWCYLCLEKELQEAEKRGSQMRKVSIVRLPGLNHFAHWDDPRRLLQALVTENGEV